MSVGGRIIENKVIRPSFDGVPRDVQRLWVCDRQGDEVFVMADTSASVLEPGEEVWWQEGTIYARGDSLQFKKIGPSWKDIA